MPNPCKTPGFRYRPQPKPRQASVARPCLVYFISTEDVPGFPIKIGFTAKAVEKRLAELQTGCPYRLIVLAKVEATTSYEWIVHKELHRHRLEGEWFRRTPEVLAEIKAAQKQQKKYDEHKRLLDEAWENLPEDVKTKVMGSREQYTPVNRGQSRP